MNGFQCANQLKDGCLTSDQTVRLHSCEPGTKCPALSSPETIFITPILSRHRDGQIIAEIGIGGGAGDLTRNDDSADLDHEKTKEMIKSCEEFIRDASTNPEKAGLVTQMLSMEGLGLSDRVLPLDSQTKKANALEVIECAVTRPVAKSADAAAVQRMILPNTLVKDGDKTAIGLSQTIVCMMSLPQSGC